MSIYFFILRALRELHIRAIAIVSGTDSGKWCIILKSFTNRRVETKLD